MGDNFRNSESTVKKLKKTPLLKKATRLVSTKLGTRHFLVEEDSSLLNEGPGPFPMGDNSEIAKIH